MLFDIIMLSQKQLTKIPTKSILIKFFDNTEFNNYLNLHTQQIGKVQKDNYLKEKDSEIKYWQKNEPELMIIKKYPEAKNFNVDFFRNYLSGIIQSIDKFDFENIIIEIPEEYPTKIFLTHEYYFQTFVEGIFLGNYTFNKYKTEKRKLKKLKIYFLTQNTNLVNVAITKGKILTEAVCFTRDLVNEPSNSLTPREFSLRVKREFSKTNVKVQIFDEKELIKRKMNAILSVGKGSENKPNLIIAHYKPKKKGLKKIALVGKGITFDTGGLSIKPTAGMLEMKADMAGGATALGIIKAASTLNLPFEIIAIVPAVENMISGKSYKPSDIISTASGKTIEVKDTDAEGRLVLADALEFASKQKPDQIIDFATLTGAVAVALGLFTAGIFSKSDKISDDLFASGERTYEKVWRLPLWDEFDKLIESKIADVSNLGPRWGGAITAAKFLEHFVDENINWVHIDLAGPAIQHDLTNYTKNYSTGYGVRLIIDYLSYLS